MSVSLPQLLVLLDYEHWGLAIDTQVDREPRFRQFDPLTAAEECDDLHVRSFWPVNRPWRNGSTVMSELNRHGQEATAAAVGATSKGLFKTCKRLVYLRQHVVTVYKASQVFHCFV